MSQRRTIPALRPTEQWTKSIKIQPCGRCALSKSQNLQAILQVILEAILQVILEAIWQAILQVILQVMTPNESCSCTWTTHENRHIETAPWSRVRGSPKHILVRLNADGLRSSDKPSDFTTHWSQNPSTNRKSTNLFKPEPHKDVM